MNDLLFRRKMDAHGRITISQDLRMRMTCGDKTK